MKPRVLIIDDDQEFINDLSLLLKNDFNISHDIVPENGIQKVTSENPDIVLLDLMFEEGINGLEILSKIKVLDDSLPVIMITDYGSIETAIKAIRLGAIDYISKTPNLKELNVIIEKALKQRSTKLQTISLKEENRKNYHEIIGQSVEIQDLMEIIDLTASNINPLLITGESGTGKELVARQIHLRGDRKNRPFIGLNCAAIPKDLVESELFGYEKGAFTGANKRKLGKFEVASDGIIFFDEITALSLDTQVKLLRVLQEKEFERVGGNASIQSKARIVAATNENPEELVKSGLFREDLFYRLDVLRIHVPPLRERKEDIQLLINHFLERTCLDMKIPKKTITEKSRDILMKYDWPGNIRELRNYITRSVILTKGEKIDLEKLKQTIKILSRDPSASKPYDIPETWEEMATLRKDASDKASREVEKLFLQNLLNKYQGNVTQAARNIGMNRTNFHKMMKRCGL